MKALWILIGTVALIFQARISRCDEDHSYEELIRQWVAQYNVSESTFSNEGPADYLPTKTGTVQLFAVPTTVVTFTNTVTDSQRHKGSRDVSIVQDISAVGARFTSVYKIIKGAPALLLAGIGGEAGDDRRVTNCGVAPEIVLLFPLEEGKSWTALECASPRIEFKRTVEGQKEVTVKAGTFNTWVVRDDKSEDGVDKTSWRYYAKGIGAVLDEDLNADGERQRVWELVSVSGTSSKSR